MPLPANDQIEAVFAADGPLSRAIDAFRMRPQQIEMAQAIAQAMRDNSLLVTEAGTGTGKTFAYLVPALLSGGKVIVSTGTKNLQDQLYNRDLPTVRDALRIPVGTALLKGRANYVCHHHLEGAIKDGRFASREDVAHLHQIARFAKASKSGDKAELAGVPETAPAWQSATSSVRSSPCSPARRCAASTRVGERSDPVTTAPARVAWNATSPAPHARSSQCSPPTGARRSTSARCMSLMSTAMFSNGAELQIAA